jgi:hypothetical protein
VGDKLKKGLTASMKRVQAPRSGDPKMRTLALATATLFATGCADVADPSAAWLDADQDLDGWAASLDCDDADAAVNPDALEVCGNGVDDNCDGTENQCSLQGSFDLEVAARVVGDSEGDHAGWSVAGVGDLDGDGHDDVVMGAYEDDEAGAFSGAVWVFYGPIEGKLNPGEADAKLTGEAAGDHAGYSVAAAGDVNGDGNKDLLVGAHASSFGGAGSGSAYVVFGPIFGTHSLADADLRIRGAAAYDYLGMAVAGAGDVTGDGLDDVLVGAYGHDGGGMNSGAAYVVPGGHTGEFDAADGHRLLGYGDESWAGASVAAGGDLNGDGVPDVIVGAQGAPRGGPDAGAVYILHGPITGDRSLEDRNSMLIGAWAHDRAGSSIAAPGDLTGDGHPDVVVGAWGYDGEGAEAGAVWVVTGPFTGNRDLRTEPLRFDGAADGDRAGIAVAGGDLDGDGAVDLVVGALHPDDATRGAVHVMYGPLDSGYDVRRSDVRFDGEEAGDLAGFALASAGDTNGDGIDDLFIGAHGSDAGGAGAGAAYIVRGTGW